MAFYKLSSSREISAKYGHDLTTVEDHASLNYGQNQTTDQIALMLMNKMALLG